MALQDIDDLSEKEQGASGHVDQHKKMVRGLKSLKSKLIVKSIANSDTINSWWCKNRSQYDETRQRVYFTGVTRSGLMHIGLFDIRRNTVKTFPLWSYEADDHNTPAFLIEDDKVPLVIGTRHDVDQVVRLKRGASPHELDTLGTTIEIPYARTVSYAQIMRQDGTNNVAVFARASDGWYCSRSTDYGLTWGTAFRFYGLGYGTFKKSGNFIHYAVTTHPTTVVNNSIRYFRINTQTGAITNAAGTTIDNLWTMTSVIAGTSMTYVRQSYDDDEGLYNTNRLLDVGPDGSIFVCRFHKNNPEIGGQYGVYRYSTTSATPSANQNFDDTLRGWSFEPIVNSGIPALYYSSCYVGGGEFTNSDNEIWLSRENSGTWSLQKYQKIGNVWQLIETRLSYNDGKKLGRPQIPIGSESKGILLIGEYHRTVPENYWDYYADQVLSLP